MDVVYLKAHFTIVACAGDVYQGLPGVKHYARSPQPRLDIGNIMLRKVHMSHERVLASTWKVFSRLCLSRALRTTATQPKSCGTRYHACTGVEGTGSPHRNTLLLASIRTAAWVSIQTDSMCAYVCSTLLMSSSPGMYRLEGTRPGTIPRCNLCWLNAQRGKRRTGFILWS